MCRYVIKEAVACKEGHVFCKTCIDQWINSHNNGSCPVGRQSLQASDLRNIIAFDRVVESMQVFCPRRESGCGWTGALDMQTNHTLQCLQEPVPCTHTGCDRVLVRGQLDQHLDICDMRPDECTYCGHQFPIRKIPSHQRYACRLAPVMCPFNCNHVAIPREQLNGHIASTCMRAVVKCSVSACQEKVRRQELTRHLTRDATTHVDLLNAERIRNNFDNVPPTLRPTRVLAFQWKLANFQNLTDDLGPAVGIKSPVFSPLRAILVPKMSATGSMGVFICSQGATPLCLNLSVALRNGRDVFLKRTPEKRWRHPNSPLGWEDFLPLDEAKRRYIDRDGALSIQVSYQLLR
ncbi:TNF receptor-associated factor 6-like isoform X2 [Montipora foliosa]|uniref:TNF receptor-associated factor 6-like isoform X2 n=1 Tax=Montipora foliosa TaxID=591990 RepID=UPI0035F10199